MSNNQDENKQFKNGDTVLIKSWNDLENKYGYDVTTNIMTINGEPFTYEQYKVFLKNKIIKIEGIINFRKFIYKREEYPLEIIELKVETENKQDNNEREFESGAKRSDNKGKNRPDLISPYFIKRLGEHLRHGCEFYDDRNWEKGMPDSVLIESLERHWLNYKLGEKNEDNLAAIAFGIMALIHNEEAIINQRLPNSLHDYPDYSFNKIELTEQLI